MTGPSTAPITQLMLRQARSFLGTPVVYFCIKAFALSEVQSWASCDCPSSSYNLATARWSPKFVLSQRHVWRLLSLWSRAGTYGFPVQGSPSLCKTKSGTLRRYGTTQIDDEAWAKEGDRAPKDGIARRHKWQRPHQCLTSGLSCFYGR